MSVEIVRLTPEEQEDFNKNAILIDVSDKGRQALDDAYQQLLREGVPSGLTGFPR